MPISTEKEEILNLRTDPEQPRALPPEQGGAPETFRTPTVPDLFSEEEEGTFFPSAASPAEFCDALHLNEEKRPVIAAGEGNKMLFAVPGSGKTTALVARIGYLIASGKARPGELLILTFTRAAAEDMAKKYNAMFHPAAGAAQPTFRTIHSFCCTEILPRLKSAGTSFPDYCLGSVIVTVDKDGKRQERTYTGRSVARYLLKCSRVPNYNDETVQDAFLNVITAIRNRMLQPADYAQQWAKIGKRKFTVSSILSAYEDTLAALDCMDFDDMLRYSYEGLQIHPEIARQVTERYRYWFIDEAQDDSLLQNRLLGLLTDRASNLMMIGDDDQSIYSFRGAAPELLLDYGKQKDTETFALSENRRSDRRIVSVMQEFIRGNHARRDKEMYPAAREEGSIRIFSPAPTVEQQYRFILEAAREAQRTHSTLGVLYRMSASALPLRFLFRKNNIPVRASKHLSEMMGSGIFGKILSVMQFACERGSYRKYRKAAGTLMLYPSKAVSEALRKLAEDRPGQDVLLLLRSLWAEEEEKLQLLDATVSLLNQIVTLSPYEAARIILLRCDVPCELKTPSDMLHMSTALSVFAMVESFRELFDLTVMIQKEDAERPEHEISRQPSEPRPTISFSTIHSAKGLEYDRVIVIDCFRKIMDDPPVLESRQFGYYDPEEERRLFYVACTRARHTLDFLTVKSYHGVPTPEPTFKIGKIRTLCCSQGFDPDCPFPTDPAITGAGVETAVLAEKAAELVAKEAERAKKAAESAKKETYYAVHVGRNPGVYTTWEECRAQIQGFSRAQYKKFNNADDANRYWKEGK